MVGGIRADGQYGAFNCCFDVKVTRDVHWYGAEHGFIRYDDKKGGQVELPVDWKL